MKSLSSLAAALLSAALLTVAGCGGGSTPPTPEPPSITLSGVAATGAAFVDAVITVIDSTGAVVGTSEPVGTDGVYAVTLSANAKAPFVLVASRTDANGDTQTLVSVVESATQTTANVTPITTLIASRLSPSGDPTKLDEELAAGAVAITPEAVADTLAEVKAILAPLLAATGTTAANPLTDSFATDGTGYDRLLDSISINIIPASTSSSNIEIAVKQKLDDGSQPVAISFPSTSTTVAALPPIDSSTLIAPGTSTKIADFLAQLTSCYALPSTERVSGTAVSAPACLAAFFNDDPSLFKNNGAVVGAAQTDAFSSLFNASVKDVVFSQGTYEFTRENGDLVIGYKSRGADGAESFGTFVVRPDGETGPLGLIGNQYQFPGGVSAYQQLRRFITLNQEDYSYYSTGYTLNVANLQSGSAAVFDRVVVTTPRNNTLTLLPGSGSANLVLPDPDGNPSGTNFVRLRSEPVNTTLVSAHPKSYDSASLFFVSTDRTEEELASTPAQGVWTFSYYLASNPSGTPTVQTYKTRARALTIGELRTKGFAELTPTLIAEIQSGADAVSGQLRLDEGEAVYVETESGGDGWRVPAGALPPTSLMLFGRYLNADNQRPRFDDSVSVRSTARKATIFCSAASQNDTHCSETVAGAYGPEVDANGLHLFSRDAGGREYAHFYAMYRLRLP